MDYVKHIAEEFYIPVDGLKPLLNRHTAIKPDGEKVGEFWIDPEQLALTVRIYHEGGQYGRCS